MKSEVLRVCGSELAAGRPCVLATIVKQRGSAPRGVGASMLVLRDGRATGTVGGGALEHDVVKQCLACFGKNASAFARYQLTPETARDLGMVCGGEVLVHCHWLNPEDAALTRALQTAQRLTAEERGVWLVRRFIGDGGVEAVDLYAQDRLWLQSDISPARARALCGRVAAAEEDGEGMLFAKPLCTLGHAYLFGGGHIARALTPLLHQLDFAPVVFDDRAEFADPSAFPQAERVVLGAFDAASQILSPTQEDYVAIMTRGHLHDHELLRQMLRTPAAYIGLIGSRSKIAKTKALLLEEGFTEADFERVRTPIGLPIGAETPMEIAVSVAAEMILCRARLNNSPKAPR